MSQRLQKVIVYVLIFSTMAGMFGMSIPAVASSTAGTFNTTAKVNLRSGPSTDTAVITLVNSGTSVEVLDHNPAGWSRVIVGGTTGFIRSDFLKFPTGSGAASFRTTAGVNVRASATTDSRVLTTVARGSNVEVTEHNPAGWSRVRANGVNGFIRSDFLTRGGDGSAAGGSSSGAITEPAAPGTVIASLVTTGTINMRSGASTSHTIIRTLTPNTSVGVTGTGHGTLGDWSSVRHNGTNGFIRSDLLKEPAAAPSEPATPPPAAPPPADPSPAAPPPAAPPPASPPPPPPPPVAPVVIATLKTVTDVNFRTGPDTSYERIRLLPPNTSVDVIENHSNGWSSVIHEGTSGFIKSDLLRADNGTDTDTVELLDWAVAKDIVPTGVNLNVVDVRTGITFQLRGFAKSGHIDVEPPTQADTEAILRTRNGIWSWAARPVWVTVGNRTIAAALNGMPHDVSTISTNGMDGHLCLHFNNTVTNSQSYQQDLRSAVIEAYNAKPR